MLKKLILVLISLSLSSMAAAKMRLIEWHTRNALAPLVLPVRDSETPEQAAERYLNNLDKNTDLMELFQGQRPVMDTVKFKELSEKNADSRLLLIANRPGDYTPSATRVEKFKLYFQKNQQESYLLPVNPNLGLSFTEKREVFDLISEKFPLLVAMGGDDVDPSSYKQENIHSKNITPSRDAEESALIKHYVTTSKGFFLGICRGSQIAAVALGYRLIQDIPIQVGETVAHGNDWHDIDLKKTTHGILRSAAPNMNKIKVNSLHHQANSMVLQNSKKGIEGPLELAAVAPDGTTEATEFKNGRGLLLQFHPELMENALGFRILSQVIHAMKAVRVGQCGRIFAN